MESLKPVHILDRNMRKECAWPLWGDRHAHSELMCCGNPIAQGDGSTPFGKSSGAHQSYCEGHARMSANSYRPQKEAA